VGLQFYSYPTVLAVINISLWRYCTTYLWVISVTFFTFYVYQLVTLNVVDDNLYRFLATSCHFLPLVGCKERSVFLEHEYYLRKWLNPFAPRIKCMIVPTEDLNVNDIIIKKVIKCLHLSLTFCVEHRTYNHPNSLPHLVDVSGGDEVNSWLCTCGYSFTYSNR
jgi:hypothetical protein